MSSEKLPRGGWPKGTWRIVLTHEDGTEETLGPSSNKMLINSKVLFAALLKNDPNYPDGIIYLAVGEGDPNWDTQGVPDPTFSQTTLITEITSGGRKAPDEIVYLDTPGGSPTLTPTGILQVKTVFAKTDLPPGGIYIREYGLFGGNATSTPDSGLMIDAIHTPSRVWKDSTVAATFYIEIEF